MAYKLEITSASRRAAKKLPKNIRREIISQSQDLKRKPFKGEKLKGKYRFLYSFHLSIKGVAYRVIYEIDKRNKAIYIRYAGSRENLYRNLDKMKPKSIV